MTTTTTSLTCCGTIIRAQGIASEAWYNGVKDIEMERLTRAHAAEAALWEQERRQLRDLIASATREGNRARKASLDRLTARARKGRRQRLRDRVRGLPALAVATVMILMERGRLLTFPALDRVHVEMRRARRRRVLRDGR